MKSNEIKERLDQTGTQQRFDGIDETYRNEGDSVSSIFELMIERDMRYVKWEMGP